MYTLYKIINNINDKIYIGSTKNLKNRESRHISDLKNDKHHSLHFQRFYNKHKDTIRLTFEVISDNHSKKEIIKIEEEYIEKYYQNSFNVSKKASGGDLLSYHPNKKDIIQRMVASIKDLREKGLIKQPDIIGIKNPNYKDGRSIRVISTCPSCGKSWETYKKYENCLCKSCFASSRTGSKNSFYGKTHTEETKAKILKSRQESNRKKIEQGLPLNLQAFPVTIEGVTYISAAQAGESLSLNCATILNRVRSNSFAFRFYNFKDQNKKFEDLDIKSKDYFVSIDNVLYENLEVASNTLQISKRKIYTRIMSKNFPNYFRKCPTTIGSIEEYNSLKKRVE